MIAAIQCLTVYTIESWPTCIDSLIATAHPNITLNNMLNTALKISEVSLSFIFMPNAEHLIVIHYFTYYK